MLPWEWKIVNIHFISPLCRFDFMLSILCQLIHFCCLFRNDCLVYFSRQLKKVVGFVGFSSLTIDIL